jgi:hypothetical protein
VYTIDLSVPPSDRYLKVITDYEVSLRQLPTLLDEIFAAVRVPNRVLHVLARLLLRKVYNKEENEELRGISKTLGLPLYLLVAYNVFLDLFMGCTSGGARVQVEGLEESRMMHFRTLDWGMPELRDVVVQYEFLERPGGEVIARTISYVGYVGVLTGLRRGLSVSINFRPYHNDDTSLAANMKFYLHQLMVLLGMKPSITSILRDFVLPRTKSREKSSIEEEQHSTAGVKLRYGYPDICTTLPSMPTTAAYLTFCTPQEAIILEKDRKTAEILKSSAFIATTNHDVSYDTHEGADHTQAAHIAHAKTHSLGMGMEDIVDESVERKRCLMEKWKILSAEAKESGKRRRKGTSSGREGIGVPLETLREWMEAYPTSNQETHYVCIMDPARGEFRWVRRYEQGDIHSELGEDQESNDNQDLNSA